MKIGYARISTSDQNMALQIDALEAAGCEYIYEETASGAAKDRPELKAALTYARTGDTLVVWKLDRLARSMKQLVDTIEYLQANEVGFVCLTQAIDTTTPSGKLVFGIFAALAEFERELIRERTLAGLAAAKAQGRVGGRPSAMTQAQIELGQDQLRRGCSVAQVARDLKVSRQSIYRHCCVSQKRVNGIGA